MNYEYSGRWFDGSKIGQYRGESDCQDVGNGHVDIHAARRHLESIEE
jgi:hypothetical protein